MNKYTNVLLSFIVVLLLLNLWLTASVLNKQASQPYALNNGVESLDSSIAEAWGEKVTGLYNLQDHQALYALFSEQAKVKISHQQLERQLKNLIRLFGKIEERALISVEKMGEKGTDVYYKMLFDIRVEDASKRLAKLTLSVVIKDNKVSLHGFRINASYPLD